MVDEVGAGVAVVWEDTHPEAVTVGAVLAAVVAADSVAGEPRDDGRCSMKFKRFVRHIMSGPWTVRRHFSAADLLEIEAAIKSTESAQGGEIRFCVESDLDARDLFAGLSPAERARQVFSQLGVWDTAQNNGVLLYLLLADRSFEIVADRAISRHVSAADWRAVSEEIEREFQAGRFLSGVKLGIKLIAKHLERHFPAGQLHCAELPNKPVIL